MIICVTLGDCRFWLGRSDWISRQNIDKAYKILQAPGGRFSDFRSSSGTHPPLHPTEQAMPQRLFWRLVWSSNPLAWGCVSEPPVVAHWLI